MFGLVAGLIVVGCADGSTSAPTTSLIPPAATTSTTSTTTITTSTTTSTTSSTTTVPAEPCVLARLGVEQLVVFGNSTDSDYVVDGVIEQPAWTELLRSVDDVGVLDGVEIINAAEPGQTMGDWDVWGPGPAFKLFLHIPEVLSDWDGDRSERTLAVIAPSFIDLQVNGYDPQRALADLRLAIDLLETAGITTFALPMNSVSETLDGRFPELNPGIVAFNALLSDEPAVTVLVERPPLLGSDGSGDDALFDDFPGHDLDGTLLGADGFHPDLDGQRRKASAVVDGLVTLVDDSLPAAAC